MIGKKMIEVVSRLDYNKDYKLYDTLVVPYTREEDFKHIMSEKPIEERSAVFAASWVTHDLVYYIDMYGRATKYVILDNEDAIA